MNATEASPRALDIAQHLIAYEATARRRSAKAQPAAFLVCEKMRRPLSKVTGSAGFRSLLMRALALARHEARALDAVKVKQDGSLAGPAYSAEEPGGALLIAQLLGLLIALVGDAPTMRLLVETWPAVLGADLGFGDKSSPASAKWSGYRQDDRRRGGERRVVYRAVVHRVLHFFSQEDAVAINQAILIESVRQHEMKEAAELLALQLQAEIAARKKTEQALIASEKLASVGRMSAVLAHEINNPIAAVMDILYLIKDVDGLPSPVPEYLEMADGELKRIAHITRQTLGFCTDISTPTTFRVCALLDSVKDMLKAKIKSKNAVVELQCDDKMEIAAMDGELRQVFSNFVLNSLHAIDQGGRVTMRASVSRHPLHGNRRIRITVSDNGGGIQAATLPHIFEPFFTTKGAVGNGLGLWVSRQIVDKHGGSLRVRSCTQGIHRGTTFSVVLPAFVA
ncbi:MAG TPA: HAMP domain-containing sensor histidine kinase [Acidobacteriaceae bacterium]|nr:HAMP domain-containing sensor histidine kinase [Acidobacteriaceae bacterium]